MFVDGTKIEANANRYTLVWAKAVAKQLEKLEVRIAKEVPEVALRYELFVDTTLEDCLSHLMKLANLVNLTFVNGKGYQLFNQKLKAVAAFNDDARMEDGKYHISFYETENSADLVSFWYDPQTKEAGIN